MAGTLLSGTLGYVMVGGVRYAFDKWSAPMEMNLPDMTNFDSGGAQELVIGVLRGQIDVEGPWKVGAMPLVVGGTYVWQLGVSASIFIMIVGTVQGITPSNDVKDGPRAKVKVQSNGTFTAAIV